ADVGLEPQRAARAVADLAARLARDAPADRQPERVRDRAVAGRGIDRKRAVLRQGHADRAVPGGCFALAEEPARHLDRAHVRLGDAPAVDTIHADRAVPGVCRELALRAPRADRAHIGPRRDRALGSVEVDRAVAGVEREVPARLLDRDRADAGL